LDQVLEHYCRLFIAGCGVLILSSCGMPDEIGNLHRQALASERTAVQALNQLSDDVTRDGLEELRATYEQSAGEAKALRERLRGELVARRGGTLIGEKIAEASQLNDDLLRCHETLEARATEAFRFVQSGRARRGSVKDVWGLVDPRTCFDELAPAWEALLE
jgi:hypothetical protein